MNEVISYSIAPTALPGVMELSLSIAFQMDMRIYEFQEYVQDLVLELIGGVVVETDSKTFLQHIQYFISSNGRTDLVVRLWS